MTTMPVSQPADSHSLLQTRQWEGLPEASIPELRRQYGRNLMNAHHSGGTFRRIWDMVREPMFLMLLVACLLYFILREPDEGVLMLLALGFVGAISLYQEYKSSKALSLLRRYTEPQITVIRDGRQQVIPSEDLVPGDIIQLEEGRRIPADALILQANDLSVDESLITGESLSVEKNGRTGEENLFQGSSVITGRCIARVTATGDNTLLGKLGKSLGSIPTSKTQLQEQISHFVKRMAFFGIGSFALVWGLNYWHTGSFAQSLLLGLTLAMSAIPEEIPVAFSSFMALGAYHMSRLGIITRQPQTIENLGAVSVICLDKTGTITENRMRVTELYDAGLGRLLTLKTGEKIPGAGILRIARLASEEIPFDPMEAAILEAYEAFLDIDGDRDLRMVHEYPLGGTPPMMTHIWADDKIKVIAAKGAPERIIRICKMEGMAAESLRERIHQLASQGFRVLGVASAQDHVGDYPEQQDDFDWHFEGLLGLNDPPKTNVHTVFNKWYEAGIGIKLITGDYAATAFHVAKAVGMQGIDEYLTGEEVMDLEARDLQLRCREVNLFARMFPEAKLRVVDALKANGEIVAMTGDGVNDGPALKSAHIGIAMGGRGTEIAREAADLVLTDDNLEKITNAILQGRKIYNNLKKAVRYIISIHVPIILTASLPLVLGWKFPNIFTPIHVIFLELIMGPTCSVFFEREPVEYNTMQQPPRVRALSMFSASELATSLLQGLVISGTILSLYYYFMQAGYPLEYVRAMVFSTLIMSNIFLTFVNRSFEASIRKTIRYPNNLVVPVLLISVLFLLLISFVPPVRLLFGLSMLSPLHFLLGAGFALAATGWFELYKASRGRII
jgi:P-type Ca2+ transporter type 2C